MSQPRLQVVAMMPGSGPEEKRAAAPQQSRRLEAQAKYERLWHIDPERFNPLKDCAGRERIKRTLDFLHARIDLSRKKVADLGCGSGELTQEYAKSGAVVDALDIAGQPLQKVNALGLDQVKTSQDYVPHTLLNDTSYDVVAATEIIAELPQQECRLFFSELARLVKKEGFVLCSTALDIYSEDALSRFIAMAETELEIIAWKFSHHFLWIKLGNVLAAPDHFAQACSQKNVRGQQLKERYGFNRAWFWLNSLPVIGHCWKALSWLANPFHRWIRQQRWILISLEKASEFFWDESGISHVILLARRRPLIPQQEPSQIPPERQQKRRVWE
jgi:2-polyprenyl-3-methyl-5-hydroxy-6-metoxy-1,4-benzoquinol methylase